MKLKFGQSQTHSSKERELVILKNKEREREVSFSKMKYLEGGSIGVAEQGGLKAKAVEVVMRR